LPRPARPPLFPYTTLFRSPARRAARRGGGRGGARSRRALCEALCVRAVVYTGSGGREVVRVEERADPVPGSEDVLVAATFAGLNAADLAQRAGRYPAPPGSPQDVPGLEVGGTVVAKGDAVRGLDVGDRVFGLVGGGGLA